MTVHTTTDTAIVYLAALDPVLVDGPASVYVAEASTLELAPGCWPTHLVLVGHAADPLVLRHEGHLDDGDAGEVYATGDGVVRLEVLND
jgi:hypothetical protein